MAKKIYIAGPMTGKREFNFPAFFAAEHKLKNDGWEVFNPAQNDVNNGVDVTNTDGAHEELTAAFDLRKALAWDMTAVCKSDAIYMLNGWEYSPGARAEHALAATLKLEFYYQ